MQTSLVTGEPSPLVADRKRQFLIGLLLFCLAVLPYRPVLDTTGFVWDDDTHVTANLVTEPGGLRDTWFSTQQPNYWPVTWTVTWAQWRLWGMNPTPYHVLNLLLHAANCVLLWLVVRRLLSHVAFAAALLFALHPVNVETVAWITQLKNLLAMLFGLLAMLALVREPGIPSRRAIAVSALWFLISVLSKPAWITLPAVLVVIAWWKGILSWRYLWRLAPLFAVAAIAGAVELWFQTNRSAGTYVIRSDPFAARAAGAAWAFWFYLWKALVPANLAFIYPRWEIDPHRFLAWIPALGMVVMLVMLWVERRWSPARGILAGLLIFFLGLFPVLGFANVFYMRYSLVADHYQYFALPGVLTIIAAGIYGVASRLSAPHRSQVAFISAITVVSIIYGALSWQLSRQYVSAETLWKSTLVRNPQCWMCYTSLGTLRAKAGDLGTAAEMYDKALELNPDYTDALVNAGLLKLMTRDTTSAITLLSRARELNPQDPVAARHLNYAQGLQKSSAVKDARRSPATEAPAAPDGSTGLH